MVKKVKKDKRLKLWLTEEQREQLKQDTTNAGFTTISEYIRFQLFLTKTTSEKINKIYQKVCYDNQ